MRGGRVEEDTDDVGMSRQRFQQHRTILSIEIRKYYIYDQPLRP